MDLVESFIRGCAQSVLANEDLPSIKPAAVASAEIVGLALAKVELYYVNMRKLDTIDLFVAKLHDADKYRCVYSGKGFGGIHTKICERVFEEFNIGDYGGDKGGLRSMSVGDLVKITRPHGGRVMWWMCMSNGWERVNRQIEEMWS